MALNDYQASAGISKHLSALATSFMNDNGLYVTEQIAIPLHQSGLVTGNFQRNQANWSDLEADFQARQQAAVQIDDEEETLVTFRIDDHALRVFIPERDILLRAQAGISRDRVIQNQVRRITGALLVQREKRLADLITNSANYNANNTMAAANPWADDDGTPIQDILTAIAQIAKGPAKNSEYYMVADEAVWISLLGAPQIRSAIGGLAFAPDYDTIGRILHIRPIISRGAYDGTNSFFGSNAIIFKRPINYSPEDESIETSWRLVYNTQLPIVVREYTTPELAWNGFFIEGKSNYQFINPYGDADDKYTTAFLITGVTA